MQSLSPLSCRVFVYQITGKLFIMSMQKMSFGCWGLFTEELSNKSSNLYQENLVKAMFLTRCWHVNRNTMSDKRNMEENVNI